MTLTEAAACGTPAVATRITGHDDAVVDGESGILVDDLAGFVDAAESIIADPMLRRRLSLARCGPPSGSTGTRRQPPPSRCWRARSPGDGERFLGRPGGAAPCFDAMAPGRFGPG